LKSEKSSGPRKKALFTGAASERRHRALLRTGRRRKLLCSTEIGEMPGQYPRAKKKLLPRLEKTRKPAPAGQQK